MLQSIVQQRGSVTFPVHTGERVYMKEFRKQSGLPKELSRWQSTVDAMLEGIDTDGPGLHIDGYWVPELRAWDNNNWITKVAGHDTRPGGHITQASAWKDEAIILASDVSASRALSGYFEGLPGDGGDCSHINTSEMMEHRLACNTVYAGNVLMLHESLPLSIDCQRSLVRLNVPGWSPQCHN